MKNVIIKIILSAVASLLHTIGFYVLWNVRQRNPYMATQRLYLMNLSIAENFHSTFLGLYNVFYLIGHEDWGTYMFVLAAGGGFLWYMSILIMLTVDRFLTVYLNLRYLLVWNVKKTKFVLKLCFFFAFVANIFFLVYLDTYEKALRCYSIFVWFPIDNLFILVSIVTYIYILVRVLRRNRKTRNSASSLVENSSSQTTTANEQEDQSVKSPPNVSSAISDESISRSPTYTWKTFTIPFLLIATFILFIGFPDNSYFYYFILNKPIPAIVGAVSFAFYPTGILCDAVIYILCQQDVRKYLFDRLSCTRRGADYERV